MVRISPHPLGDLLSLISFLVLAIQCLPAMRSQSERGGDVPAEGNYII